MSGSGLVSVIMPTFNHAHFIGDAINSVLQQTYGNLELLIIDNYSKDNTEDIVESFKSQDKRIRYEKFANQGIIANARNRGLELAQGEYIAFLDSDDYWDLKKTELQLPLLQSKQIGCVYSSFVNVNHLGKVYNETKTPDFYQGEILNKLLIFNFVSCASLIVKKDVLTKGNYLFQIGRQGAEDWDMWLRLAMVTEFAFANYPLLYHREHDQAVSHNYELMFNSQLVVLNDVTKNLLEKKVIENTKKKELLNAILINRTNTYISCAYSRYSDKKINLGFWAASQAIQLRPFYFSTWKVFLIGLLKSIKLYLKI